MSPTLGLDVSGETRKAVTASELTWRSHGETPVVLAGEDLRSLGLDQGVVEAAVVVPRRHLIECYVEPDVQYKLLVGDITRLGDGAWEIWILLPLDALGSGHEELRGLPVRLQPWWIEGGQVRFGLDETP